MSMRKLTRIALSIITLTVILLPVNAQTIEIQEPDFYEIGIEYNWSFRDGSITQTIMGELIEIIEQPVFTKGGPARFSDGSIATQTISIQIYGWWGLKGNMHREYNNTFHFAEKIFMARSYMTFGLTEDNGDGQKWRIMSGTIPSGFIDPGHPNGDMVRPQEDYRICLQDNNDLSFYAEGQNDNYYRMGHQSLTTFDCRSMYPNFTFISNHGYLFSIGDWVKTETIDFVITLASGVNEN